MIQIIITWLLTVIFGLLVLADATIPPFFEEIYRLVIVFYFCTQYHKYQENLKFKGEKKDE